MIRKILVVLLFLTTCLDGVNNSTSATHSLGNHPIIPMKENVTKATSEQQLKEILSAWNDVITRYAQKSMKQSNKVAIVASLTKVKSLIKELARDLYSHKDILGIYRVRATIISNGSYDEEVSSLLVDGWPQIGCMYPQTPLEVGKRRWSYGKIKGDPIAKKLFADESASDSVPSRATRKTSFSSTTQDFSPTKTGISEPVIHLSADDLDETSEPTRSSRLKMFSLGAVLGLVGYLCVAKAFPSNNLATTTLI